MSRGLALFDFDGTITGADTLLHFLRHAVPAPRFWLGALALSPVLAAFKLGLLGNDRAKSLVLTHFFQGLPVERLAAAGESFCREALPGLLRPGALARIAWHRERGDRVVVISASLRQWVEPWCREQGLELLATEPEAGGGLLTGGYALPNCHGPEKVRRLRGLLDPSDYGPIFAYGDSAGDREMLALAHEPHYRPFRD